MKIDQSAVERIVRNVVDYGLSTRYVADRYGISVRRVQQLCREYRLTGKVPRLGRPGRRRKRVYDAPLQLLIVRTAAKYGCGAVTTARILRLRYGIRIDNNAVHMVLKVNGMARTEPNKRRRKRPWVRYERSHSLSAVHMDWYYNSTMKKWVCAVLDDASRMILAAGEFDRATAENSIKLLDEAYRRYIHIAPIREVITDHGAQFYANKRRKDGSSSHSFEEYCRRMGIKHILCRYKHPQSNGKLEKWFHVYQRHRGRFETLEEFIEWYNRIRPHMSLNFDELETPEKAFYRKAQDIILGNFFRLVENGGETHAK